jgi:hypothetical protein
MRLKFFRRAPAPLPSVAEVFEWTRTHPASFLRAEGHPCALCSAKFRTIHTGTWWHRGTCEAEFRAKAIYAEQEVPVSPAARMALRRATLGDSGQTSIRPAAWPDDRAAGGQRPTAHDVQRGGSATLPTDNRKRG